MCSPVFRIIIFCVGMISLVACKKDKNTIHIEGKVYDPNTAAYVSDARVTIAASKLSSGGIFSAGYADIATAVSDAGGNFVFTFEEEKFGGFQIRVEKENYFSTFKEISTSEIVAGTTYTPTLNILPVCFIDLKIRNAAPYDTNDLVFYSFTSGFLNGSGCCGNTITYGHGLYYADTVLCKTHGNQNVTLSYNVRKEGITTLHTKTLYCTAFDTTYFVIDY